MPHNNYQNKFHRFQMKLELRQYNKRRCKNFGKVIHFQRMSFHENRMVSLHLSMLENTEDQIITKISKKQTKHCPIRNLEDKIK